MNVDAYNEFATQVAVFAAAEGIQVAYPGVPFDVPASGLWLEITWVPNLPLNYGIANDGPTLERGLASITVGGPSGGGTLPVIQLAEKVRQEFGKGTRWGGVKVYSKPAINVLPSEPHRVAAVVTAQWHGADT